MNRINFAHASGVILDICKQHGLWLDRGELQAVLAFVGSGGLTVARSRAAEMEKEEERRSEVTRAEVARLPILGGYDSDARSWDRRAPAAVELLFRQAISAIFKR
jgi:Zn-finger nucleic acid-binding protein